MIIIKLQGGLGNQLFQYAFARNMSIENNTNLKFDISWYKNSNNRFFKLNSFNTKIEIASNKEVVKYFKKDNLQRKIQKSIDLIKLIKFKKIITENDLSFNDKYLNIGKNCYVNGYWQSEKYFKNIENIIRKEFTLKEKINDNLFDIYKLIEKSNSISIHIRRGDYLSNKYSRKYHVLQTEYYLKTIELITKKIKNPHFFIFSDDIKWAQDNLNINFNKTFIEPELGSKDYEELILMSKCKHNIIANSSFSWWGAWLNNNTDKIVIAPKDWYKIEAKKTCDLILKSWITI